MAARISVRTYKYNFLAEPDSALVCGICSEVAEDPRQHAKCGKLFCKKCLDQYGRNLPCPKCLLGENEQQYFEDIRSRREIKALPIGCKNKDRACKWEGTVDSLEQHLVTCEYFLVPCPNQCKNSKNDIQQCTKRDLDAHLLKDCPERDHTCQHCGEKGTYATIVQIHDKMCKKKVIPCSNAGCRKSMERQRIDEHFYAQCPYTVIACKYKGIGCASQLRRKDMAAHKKRDKLHLHMALDTVNKLQRLTVVTLKRNESITFALSEYQKRKEANEVFVSPSFYTHPNGYHMEVRVYPNGSGNGRDTHVTISTVILEGDNDRGLKWPLVGKYTLALLNQLEDRNHHTVTLSIGIRRNINVGSNVGKPIFIAHCDLGRDPTTNTQYLKDDTLYLRASVEVADQKSWLQCTAK